MGSSPTKGRLGMSRLDNFVNTTGGAYGADTLGCIVGLSYGFKKHIHLRPEGNPNLSKKLRLLMFKPTLVKSAELDFARKQINSSLNKNYKGGIACDLQSRNYWQVTNSDAVYCFATKNSDNSVSGGTNTALQLAIFQGKPAYVFDVDSLKWFMYNNEVGSLCEIDFIPELLYRYAIVGTRDIEDYQIKCGKTGMWISRPNYLGVEKEIAVTAAMSNLYLEALKKIEEEEDLIQ